MSQSSRSSREATTRRSPCPVACALDVLGDRWTLLVVRDLLLGKRRFKEFTASPERIPTNILTDRLERLVRQKIAIRVPSSDGGRHLSYQLTEKGLALGPTLVALKRWGLHWEEGTAARIKPRG